MPVTIVLVIFVRLIHESGSSVGLIVRQSGLVSPTLLMAAERQAIRRRITLSLCALNKFALLQKVQSVVRSTTQESREGNCTEGSHSVSIAPSLSAPFISASFIGSPVSLRTKVPMPSQVPVAGVLHRTFLTDAIKIYKLALKEPVAALLAGIYVLSLAKRQQGADLSSKSTAKGDVDQASRNLRPII